MPSIRESDESKVILCRTNYAKFKNPKTKICENVEKFKWTTANRLEVSLITFGASFVEIKIPDREGEMKDVLFGYESFEDRLLDRKFNFGSIDGQLSGVVKNAAFCVQGKFYRVPKNFKGQHWSSGFDGLGKVNWNSFVNGNEVILSHATDESEKFPGVLLVQIFFSVLPNNSLVIKTTARTSRVTPVDISHRFFFNLASHDAGEENLMEHLVTVDSKEFCVKNADGIGGEAFEKVESTNFDLTARKSVLDVLEACDGAFDCQYVIDEATSDGRECKKDVNLISRIVHPPTGRVLEIFSNQKTFQLSTCADFPESEEKIYSNSPSSEKLESDSIENLTLEYLRTKLTEKEIEFFKCRTDTDSMKLDEKESEKMFIDCPGLTKNGSEVAIKGKDGANYRKNSGLFFSCQNIANSVQKQSEHPDILLMPGQVYENVLVLKFAVHVQKNVKLDMKIQD